MKFQIKPRRLRAAVYAFVLAFSAVLANVPALQTYAAAVTPESGNIYYLKNKNSGLYLSVENDSTANGANIIQSTGTGSVGQRWILEKNSDGSYRIHPATDMTGAHSIDIVNGNSANGTNVRVWENNGCTAQNFKLTNTGDGYMITSAVTNYGSCLDVSSASKSSGANVLQWTCKSSANQIWYFEQAPWPNSGNSSSSSSGSSSGTTVSIDSSYSMQKLQFVSANNNTLITAPSSNGALSSSTTSSVYNQWVLVNNGSNQYLIANAKTGYVLAPSNNSATSGASIVATAKTGSTAQYWTISAATKDTNGDGLTYKISNCANTSLCLQLSGSKYILGEYKGSSTHRFYVNTYGVEGFAGNCKSVSGKAKASITGGALGTTVTVSDFNSLSKYCAGSTPYTIVITGNISQSSLSKITVGKNKTIIGSFNANTLNNVHFRCISSSGNVIFKNLTLKHDSDKNENDDIQIYISDGNNFWIDHCTFPGHSSLTSSDVDKLLYVGLKADYVTVSGNIFMNHKYGLILGYPGEDGAATYSGYPQMTLCNNYFYGVITRAPGLMRYGYFHSYNNFVYDFDLGYTPYTGCNIYSEKNYFSAGSHKGAVVNDMGIGNFTDSGSVLSSSVSNISLSQTSFRPSNCYSYATRDASSAKSWCQNYAGVKNGALTYAID